MERTCSKDEQRIQLLSAEESESNSPEIQLQRPQSCLNKYWKILVITPLLVLLLLLTYWITTKGGQNHVDAPANQSAHFPVNHTVNNDVEDEVPKDPDGCHVGLYSLAKIQMNNYDLYGASETAVHPSEVRHDGQLVALQEVPGQSITTEILVHEIPIHTQGGSSFIAFIGGNHSAGIGLFRDNKNGTYSICCSLPPECVNITVRLYSFDYRAYRTVKTQGTLSTDDVGIRTAFHRRICPSKASIEAGMSHIPPKCTHNDISMKPGSWSQINTQWFWKSHEENCLVPDMAINWMQCAPKVHEIHFFGDGTTHWYNFFLTRFFSFSFQNPSNVRQHEFLMAQSCKDIHKLLFGVQTVPDKLTYVIMHCGSKEFYDAGYTTLQTEIRSLFAKVKEARRISPNLRFVFILSALKKEIAKSASSGYTELNMFSSAAINSWIADQAGIDGISVFDELYPKTMGLAHIGIVDKPLTNLMLYHICNMN